MRMGEDSIIELHIKRILLNQEIGRPDGLLFLFCNGAGRMLPGKKDGKDDPKMFVRNSWKLMLTIKA